MQLVDFETLKSITFGAVEWEENADTFSAHRFTESQRAVWKKDTEFIYGGVLCTAGIRLDFHTDADQLRLTVGGADTRTLERNALIRFEILVDGVLTETLLAKEAPTLHMSLPAGEHRITVIFPSHVRGYLHQLEISDGATVLPHRYDMKLLMTGDSITQGWNSGVDCLSYVWRTALALNADLLNHGVGGAQFHATTYEDLSFAPDLITVAYGCNDYSHVQSEAILRTNVNGFLSALDLRYPDVRKIGILPIPRLAETVVKPLKSFENCSRILAEEYTARGYEIIDGRNLVPKDASLYSDNLHPNADGFAVYAERLLSRL